MEKHMSTNETGKPTYPWVIVSSKNHRNYYAAPTAFVFPKKALHNILETGCRDFFPLWATRLASPTVAACVPVHPKSVEVRALCSNLFPVTHFFLNFVHRVIVMLKRAFFKLEAYYCHKHLYILWNFRSSSIFIRRLKVLYVVLLQFVVLCGTISWTAVLLKILLHFPLSQVCIQNVKLLVLKRPTTNRGSSRGVKCVALP